MQWTGSVFAASAGHTMPEPRPEPDPAVETDSTAPPLVVILGPTAIGKTALSITLAQALNGEIVSADSRQIYCSMDIGTAKPPPAERAAVPHHLLDLVAPDEILTLAQYQHAAYETIDAIHAGDCLPFLVGGTGQYITAVIEGWGIPEVVPNHALRAELEQYAAEHGALALHDRLRASDPAAADRIDYRNVRRVVRALEVYLETGTPISVQQNKQPPPYRMIQIGLTMPREQLYERADKRIDQMIAGGLLDEVRGLLAVGYTWDTPAMSGLGYAQWKPYLDGEISLEAAIAAIRHDTRAYIRRQYTWFKGHDAGIHWIDVNQVTPEMVLTWLKKQLP